MRSCHSTSVDVLGVRTVYAWLRLCRRGLPAAADSFWKRTVERRAQVQAPGPLGPWIPAYPPPYHPTYTCRVDGSKVHPTVSARPHISLKRRRGCDGTQLGLLQLPQPPPAIRQTGGDGLLNQIVPPRVQHAAAAYVRSIEYMVIRPYRASHGSEAWCETARYYHTVQRAGC